MIFKLWKWKLANAVISYEWVAWTVAALLILMCIRFLFLTPKEQLNRPLSSFRHPAVSSTESHEPTKEAVLAEPNLLNVGSSVIRVGDLSDDALPILLPYKVGAGRTAGLGLDVPPRRK
jgi:hypothetical protein